ncbi:hypothetical protein AMTRI_Chr06g173340 [Amborella trichopoda]
MLFLFLSLVFFSMLSAPSHQFERHASDLFVLASDLEYSVSNISCTISDLIGVRFFILCSSSSLSPFS